LISLESVLVWKINNQTSFLGGLLKSKILQFITEQGCSVIIFYRKEKNVDIRMMVIVNQKVDFEFVEKTTEKPVKMGITLLLKVIFI